MLPSIAATSSHLQLLPAILYAADPALCKHLSGLQPFFALAATLTLYAHDIEEYGGIARLFDFLLSHEAVVSVYMYATVCTPFPMTNILSPVCTSQGLRVPPCLSSKTKTLKQVMSLHFYTVRCYTRPTSATPAQDLSSTPRLYMFHDVARPQIIHTFSPHSHTCHLISVHLILSYLRTTVQTTMTSDLTKSS